jgi:hypothetical protein
LRNHTTTDSGTILRWIKTGPCLRLIGLRPHLPSNVTRRSAFRVSSYLLGHVQTGKSSMKISSIAQILRFLWPGNAFVSCRLRYDMRVNLSFSRPKPHCTYSPLWHGINNRITTPGAKGRPNWSEERRPTGSPDADLLLRPYSYLAVPRSCPVSKLVQGRSNVRVYKAWSSAEQSISSILSPPLQTVSATFPPARLLALAIRFQFFTRGSRCSLLPLPVTFPK